MSDATPKCSLREGAKLPALNPAKSIAAWNEWGYRAKERTRLNHGWKCAKCGLVNHHVGDNCVSCHQKQGALL